MTDEASLTTASNAALAEADDILDLAKRVKHDDLRLYCVEQISQAHDAQELRAANALVREVLRKRYGGRRRLHLGTEAGAQRRTTAFGTGRLERTS